MIHRFPTYEEVDDVNSTLMHQTPAIGLSTYVAGEQSCTGPNGAVQGTGLPFAGLTLVVPAAAQAALAGVRSTDLPGSPPRGAPV